MQKRAIQIKAYKCGSNWLSKEFHANLNSFSFESIGSFWLLKIHIFRKKTMNYWVFLNLFWVLWLIGSLSFKKEVILSFQRNKIEYLKQFYVSSNGFSALILRNFTKNFWYLVIFCIWSSFSCLAKLLACQMLHSWRLKKTHNWTHQFRIEWIMNLNALTPSFSRFFFTELISSRVFAVEERHYWTYLKFFSAILALLTFSIPFFAKETFVFNFLDALHILNNVRSQWILRNKKKIFLMISTYS